MEVLVSRGTIRHEENPRPFSTPKRLVDFFVNSLLFNFDKILLGDKTFIRMHDVFEATYADFYNYGELFFNHGFFSWFPHAAGGSPSFATIFLYLNPIIFLSSLAPL